MSMRKAILYLCALGFAACGTAVFVERYLWGQHSGNPEEIWAGLFLGSVLGFLAVVLVVLARPGQDGAGEDIAGFTPWPMFGVDAGEDSLSGGK